jgi:sigma-E factor negative regulatory protein RseB
MTSRHARLFSRRRRAVLLVAASAWAVAGVPAHADSVANGQAAKVSAPAEGVQALLSRVRAAANAQSYQGTMVFTSGGVVASSRVGHYAVGADTFERVEALDGAGQRTFRHNEKVVTFWPQRKVVTVAHRDASASSPLGSVPEARFRAHYDVRLIGSDRVAGRSTQVLLLSPRDAFRFPQRLWVDAESGLMLRADVLGSRGDLLESTAFTDIEVGVRPQSAVVQAAMREVDGWRVVQMNSVATRLEEHGWRVVDPPEGFELLGCVLKPVTWAEPVRDLTEGAGRSTTPGPSSAMTQEPMTLQVIYSDGLARVSIFIESKRPGQPAKNIVTQMGATHALLQNRDERWRLVLMGDVPATTLKRFAAALYRVP